MRHLLFWIITVPLVVVLVDFSVMNTQDIALNFWPLPWDMPLPAYALIFGAGLIGFLGGVFVMWRHGSTGRRRHRELNRQLNVQAGELESLRRQTESTSVGSSRVVARTDPNALVPPAI